MGDTLAEYLDRLAAIPEEKREELLEEAADATRDRVWVPNPGAQSDAYFSQADEIGFGGEAGPGKTALIIGLSLTRHKRCLVMRRTNKEAAALVDEYEMVLGAKPRMDQYGAFRYNDRKIRIGGVQHESDKQKYKGQPYDLIAFDEVVDFTRTQYEFIIQWNRSTDPDQRCKVVATFNPPTHPTGLWVIERFAPWLDPKHPNPAESGEVRWFTSINDVDTEVDGPGPHVIEGEAKPVMAKSRTFIRGHLEENVVLARTGYDATRAASSGELRSAYRDGNFEAALQDVPGQCIPSDWVRAAQARWTRDPPEDVPMCSMGVDCSGGGKDPMVLYCRYDGWFAEPIEIPGKDLDIKKMGRHGAGIVITHRRDNALVIVDMGGGYGGSIYEHLDSNGVEVQGFLGSEKTFRRSGDKRYKFTNKRSAAYWIFREALDPGQPGGSPIALPPSRKLFADLTTPTFEVTPNGIKLEDKDDVMERLGRSTDEGDACVMAWFEGSKAVTNALQWAEQRLARKKRGQAPRVITKSSRR